MNNQQTDAVYRHQMILGLLLDQEIPNSEIGKKLAHTQAFENEKALDDLPESWLAKVKKPGEKSKKVMDACRRLDIGMIFLGDPEYPARLAAILDPPAVLFYKGRAELLNEDAIAVVGARRATAYGLRCARDISQSAVRHGWNIVSGLAMGIDLAAHKGAIDGGGRTLAVMAGSLEECYPRSNEWMFRKIAAEGVLICEYPPYTPPERWRFVQRNRIVSGLSSAVIVAQAGVKSGSLITATFAAEQGREVYCVPGSIYDPEYMGAHRLIQDGAGVLYDPELLFAEGPLERKAQLVLPEAVPQAVPQAVPREVPQAERILRPGFESVRVDEKAAASRTRSLREKEERRKEKAGEYLWLYEVIDDFGITPEQLSALTGKDPAILQQGLTVLELKDLVVRNGVFVSRK